MIERVGSHVAVGLTATPSQPPPKVDRGIGNGINGSTVEVELKGLPEQQGQPKHEGSSGQSGTADATVDPCWYTAVSAIAGNPILGGDDPSNGVLYTVSCPDAINLNTHQLVYANYGYVWARNGVAPVAPPPNPQQVAEEAAGQMTAPTPIVHLAPDINRVAVKVPVRLWVDNQLPMTLTVAIRGLSVKVTATMKSTSWSMGEPVDASRPSVKVPPFTCEGPGTPPTSKFDLKAELPCSYTYSWKSLKNRTNGSGKWAVNVTAVWDVIWAASDGTQGRLTRPLAPVANQQVAVGEWRGSLVENTGG